MTMPDVPVRDLMDRTKANLDFIQQEYDSGNRDVWDVTQLVNSFLAALAHPWESWRQDRAEILSMSLLEAEAHGWPRLEKDDDRDEDPKNLGELLRLMRNGIAHGNIKFISDHENNIGELRLWNADKGFRTWGTRMDVATLRRILDRTVTLAQRLPPNPRSEPRRHIKDRRKLERPKEAFVTADGQVTIPAEIRDLLGIHSFGKVAFVVDRRGNVSLRRAEYTLRDLKGIVPPLPGREAGDFEDLINEAKEDLAAEEVRKLQMPFATPEHDTEPPSVLPPEEAHALFDRQARHLAGVSGEEFLRRWDTGEYRHIPDTEEGRRIMHVISLIPFGRQ
jgi:AbrB family looped-hinge helix DNA binding protein